MAGLVGDDERLERQADEREVADQVERLVAAEFIWEAQLSFEKPIGRKDDGIFERTAANQAHGAQAVNVFRERKCACGGKLARERVAHDDDFGFLLANHRMGKFDVAAHAKFIGGVNADATVAFRNFEGLHDFQVATLAAKLANARAIEKVHKRLRGAVENGQLERVDFHVDIVDAARIKSGEQMLGGGEQHAIFHQAGGVTDARDVAAVGLNFKIVEVNAAKHDACVWRRGNEANVRTNSGMKADAFGFDRTQD